MHPRQAALLATASKLVEAVTFPREFHLPAKVRDLPPENPEGTDLYVWKYEEPAAADGKPRWCAVAFVGKQSKPIWHHWFRSPEQREAAIKEDVDNRKRVLDEKLRRKNERQNFQHSLEVGDIMYSSWGYDQTNINFYQVTEVKGKEVVLREVGSRVVQSWPGSEKVMAEPNEFISGPMRKRPQGSGVNVYVKIDSSQTAHEWDGRPLHQTAAGFGH